MNKKTILAYLAILGLGIFIGYLMHFYQASGVDPFLQRIITVVVTGSPFVAVATFVVEIVPIILGHLKRKEEERLKQDQLILDDLKNWIDKTTFHQIKYDWVNIEPVDHRDPVNLPFFEKDKEVLKNYGAFSLWENGKEISLSLRNTGIDALKNFHEKIDKKIEDIPLKRSLKIGTLSEPYYSIRRIRESIFEDINGSALNLFISPPKNGLVFLNNGAVQLAWGDVNIIEGLKKRIEGLIMDRNIKNNMETYVEVKNELDLKRTFSDFKKKIDEILNDFKWNQKLKR